MITLVPRHLIASSSIIPHLLSFVCVASIVGVRFISFEISCWGRFILQYGSQVPGHSTVPRVQPTRSCNERATTLSLVSHVIELYELPPYTLCGTAFVIWGDSRLYFQDTWEKHVQLWYRDPMLMLWGQVALYLLDQSSSVGHCSPAPWCKVC